MVDLLENREEKYLKHETIINQKIKEKLSLWWDKIEIPIALIEIHKKEKKLRALLAELR